MSAEQRARAYHDRIDGRIDEAAYRRILAADDQRASEMLEAVEDEPESDLEARRRRA